MQTFMDWGATYVKIDRCFGVDNNEMRMDLPQTFAKYREAAGDTVQISAILAATDNCWEWCVPIELPICTSGIVLCKILPY